MLRTEGYLEGCLLVSTTGMPGKTLCGAKAQNGSRHIAERAPPCQSKRFVKSGTEIGAARSFVTARSIRLNGVLEAATPSARPSSPNGTLSNLLSWSRARRRSTLRLLINISAAKKISGWPPRTSSRVIPRKADTEIISGSIPSFSKSSLYTGRFVSFPPRAEHIKKVREVKGAGEGRAKLTGSNKNLLATQLQAKISV